MITNLELVSALQDAIEWLDRLSKSEDYSIEEISKKISKHLPLEDLKALNIILLESTSLDDYIKHMINFSSVIQLLQKDTSLSHEEKEHSLSALKSAMLRYTFLLTGNGQTYKKA